MGKPLRGPKKKWSAIEGMKLKLHFKENMECVILDEQEEKISSSKTGIWEEEGQYEFARNLVGSDNKGKKVYCDECKYYYDLGPSRERCWARSNLKNLNPHKKEKFMRPILLPRVKNKNNTCSDYESLPESIKEVDDKKQENKDSNCLDYEPNFLKKFINVFKRIFNNGQYYGQ